MARPGCMRRWGDGVISLHKHIGLVGSSVAAKMKIRASRSSQCGRSPRIALCRRFWGHRSTVGPSSVHRPRLGALGRIRAERRFDIPRLAGREQPRSRVHDEAGATRSMPSSRPTPRRRLDVPGQAEEQPSAGCVFLVAIRLAWRNARQGSAASRPVASTSWCRRWASAASRKAPFRSCARKEHRAPPVQEPSRMTSASGSAAL